MNWDKWVLDASMSYGGNRCFCPVEVDDDGEVTNIIIGMNFVSDKPPHDGICIGVYHPDGQEAVERWREENPELASI